MKSEELKYITYDEALVVYTKTVVASGGGLQGVKDEGGIRKVLDFVQNDLYYPTFVDKLTYLVFGFVRRVREKQELCHGRGDTDLHGHGREAHGHEARCHHVHSKEHKAGGESEEALLLRERVQGEGPGVGIWGDTSGRGGVSGKGGPFQRLRGYSAGGGESGEAFGAVHT